MVACPLSRKTCRLPLKATRQQQRQQQQHQGVLEGVGSRSRAATADAIFHHLSHTEAAVSGHTSRRLLSDRTWLHPTLAHGKSIDFNDGGLSSQGEDMQAAIESHEAAAETAAASPGGVMGRRLLVLRGTASVSP